MKTCVAAMFALSLIATALAGFPALAQGPILPTPTVLPAENVEYTLTAVGGQPARWTVAHGDKDGFVLGNTEVSSEYPRGMVFAINPQSPNGAIQAVVLRLRFVNGMSERVSAAWDPVRGAWVARPWETGDGHPAWAHVDFSWQVRDATGAAVETEPYPVDYADPTRQWFRVETPYHVVYWFGLDDANPDRFARSVAQDLADFRPRLVAGFGRAISYRPIGVIYGSRDAMGEMYGAGIADRGGAFDEFGMSAVAVPQGGDLEVQIDWMSFVVVHELVHLYQHDIVRVVGPAWWQEGQAQWFAPYPGDWDRRLRTLILSQDLPTLTKPVPRYVEQADGRVDLAYDMGASFINWLLATYGGIETHARLVALMAGGTGFYASIEAVAGKTFFEVENEWRAYIGVAPFDLADIDPAAALEPVGDPLYEVGATFVLPATTPFLLIYEEPTPQSLAGAQCYANMTLTVLASGSHDGLDYYQVECLGMTGWVARDHLAGTTPWRVSAGGVANLRACPAEDCEIVGTANPGDTLNVILTRGDWHLIRRSNGWTAWVAVSLTEAIP